MSLMHCCRVANWLVESKTNINTCTHSDQSAVTVSAMTANYRQNLWAIQSAWQIVKSRSEVQSAVVLRTLICARNSVLLWQTQMLGARHGTPWVSVATSSPITKLIPTSAVWSTANRSVVTTFARRTRRCNVQKIAVKRSWQAFASVQLQTKCAPKNVQLSPSWGMRMNVSHTMLWVFVVVSSLMARLTERCVMAVKANRAVRRRQPNVCLAVQVLI